MKKKVSFIVLNKDKFQTFKDFLNGVDYYKVYEDFELSVLNGVSDLLKNTEENINIELRKDEKNNPSLTIYNRDIIIIKESFFDKTKEEQVCIIIHELGHVKYQPITLVDVLNKKPYEYLADRYVFENGLIKSRIKFWLKDNNDDLNRLLMTTDKDNFLGLVQMYFTLKGFKRLLNEKDTTRFIKKIEEKLLEISVDNEDVKRIKKFIDKYIIDYNNPNKLKKLDECCDRIDQNLLDLN